MGQLAKPDLFEFAKWSLNNSVKFISWKLIDIIPKKLYTEKKKNTQIWPFSDIAIKNRAIQ